MREIVKTWMARAALALVAIIIASSLALAQADVKKSPFGAGPAPTAQPSASDAATPTGSSGIWGYVLATQAKYQREMATAVREIKSANPMAAAASLAFISFMYGVLHAAGPGHGKAVISSYILANRQTMRRGIFLSFLSAFFQACSAILLVAVLALALKATSLTMKAAESWIEIASWALVAFVGVWLLYRQLKPFLATRSQDAPHVHGPGCNHDHAPAPRAQPKTAFAHVAHEHDHVHGPACNHDHAPAAGTLAPIRNAATHVHDANCGHAHMPEPSQLEGPWVWSKAISLAMTVGISPCTGAILVMLFALSQGVLWAGVFATFMMSFGTALTVSALAALAVGSRDLAVRLAGAESPWAARFESLVGIGGAIGVILLGTAGVIVALHGPAPV